MLLDVRFKKIPVKLSSSLLSLLPQVLSGTSLPDGIKYFKIFHFIGYIHYFNVRRAPLPSSTYFCNEYKKQNLFHLTSAALIYLPN